jgi:hypothetical protein
MTTQAMGVTWVRWLLVSSSWSLYFQKRGQFRKTSFHFYIPVTLQCHFIHQDLFSVLTSWLASQVTLIPNRGWSLKTLLSNSVQSLLGLPVSRIPTCALYLPGPSRMRTDFLMHQVSSALDPLLGPGLG